MKENRITIRLTSEQFIKIKKHADSKDLHLSDIVRQAIALLPNSPEEISNIQSSSMQIKPLQNTSFNVQLKDETEALKSLQEW